MSSVSSLCFVGPEATRSRVMGSGAGRLALLTGWLCEWLPVSPVGSGARVPLPGETGEEVTQEMSPGE